MARIAFAWEMGGEFGHAMACNSIGRQLRQRGHRIAYMFRELHQLAQLTDCAAHDVLQAPVSVREGHGEPTPVSLADILVGCGYDSPQHLAGMLGAWFALFRHWKPDLVVNDFAPTALLAARTLGVRRVTYGNGFSIPPRLSPLPAFRFDEAVDAARVARADARALAATNGALETFGAPPLQTLAQQFEAEEDFLTTFPELDSYGTRPRSGYWGPRVSFDLGERVNWPKGEGKRVAIYLKRSLPQLDAVIDVLAASSCRVAAFIPELEPHRAARLRSSRRIVSERPMRLDGLLKDCDLLINSGGNISPGALMYGVPQVIFPMQYEQYITARRMEQIGAGVWLGPDDTQVAKAIADVLGQPSFRSAARAFAARYPAYSPAEQQRRIIVRIEEILQGQTATQGAR